MLKSWVSHLWPNKYHRVTARCSSGATLKYIVMSCRCLLGPTLFSSSSNDSLSIRRKFLYALATQRDMHRHCVWICSLGRVASTSFFFVFYSIAIARTATISSVSSAMFVSGTKNLATGTKNWCQVLVPVFWYQNLVPVSGTYVLTGTCRSVLVTYCSGL